MAEQKDFTELLNKFSLKEKEITDLHKKDKKQRETLDILLNIIKLSELEQAERKIGALFLATAQGFQKTQIPSEYLNIITKYIVEEKITAIPRVDLAIQFIKKMKKDDQFDIEKFDYFIGVGVNVTTEDIEKAVDEYFKEKEEEIKSLRYSINQVDYRNDIQQKLRFPNMKDLFDIFKNKLTAILGEETQADKQARQKQIQKKDKSKAQPKGDDNKQKESVGQSTIGSNTLVLNIDELQGRDLKSAINSKESQKWKEDRFGKMILSRFPPEPNGYLHLGHIKAINFNFTLAKQYEGGCYLRFDDTNPDKENQEFIDSIKSNIEWLGFKPYKQTAASDNFDFLHECAVKLIKKGKAFVCGQTKDQIKEAREKCTPSPWRDQSVEKNLEMFENMRLGLYKEGEYSLRAKIDYKSPNTTLKDPIIYRIRYTPHPHSGDKWCIYPCYDFTHPLCDSIEGITHSCCTLEFEIRRELYYWVLDELDLYKPFVWEYSRLNINYSVLSKRKVQELVDKKFVSGWNDPRLLTIEGMKRRGYPAKGLLNFVSSLGVTRTSNDAVVHMDLLENKIREELDNISIRTLAVLDPIVVNITNMKDDEVKTMEVKDFPTQKESKTHTIEGRNKVYVERSDVIHMAHKDFFGIAPGTYCGLKYFGVIYCTDVVRDESGNIIQVNAEYAHDGTDKTRKPKAFINWVSVEESQECEIRLYDNLFTHEFPSKYEDGPWTDTINPDSLKVLKNARMNKNLKLNILDQYQFERQGFYAVDYDSDIKAGKIVWNRVVKLIEKDRLGALKKVLDDIAKIEAEQKQQ